MEFHNFFSFELLPPLGWKSGSVLDYMYCHVYINYMYYIDLSLWSHIFLYSAFSLIFMLKCWVAIKVRRENPSSWKLTDSIMLKEMRAHQVRKHEATKKNKKLLSLLKLLVFNPMPKFHFPLTCLNSCLLSHTWFSFSSNMFKLLSLLGFQSSRVSYTWIFFFFV